MSGPRRLVRLRSRTAVRVLAIVLFFAVAHGRLVQVAYGQDGNGRIEGRLVRNDGKGVAGASVVLKETAATDFTGTDGQFAFGDLPPGSYSITLSLGVNLVEISGVRVAAGATTPLEETVDWVVGFTDSLIVRGASRQAEPIVEAPAAATLVTEPEIERKALQGQVATLLEFTPGAQVTQGGLWDFNIGTRGFNRSLSRRVAVILDGRDLSLPFFGYQGWPAFSFPLDDLSSIELVRGPSAALFGANASGGVITMTSKEPRFSRGGMVRVAVGQLDTVNVEARWAGELGAGWYARTAGGLRRSSGFAVSRVGGPEYSVACAPAAFGDCLPQEVVPFDGEDTRIFFGGVRFDKYLNGLLLTMEGGHAHGGFGVFQAAGQRAKAIGTDGKRPWARFSVNGDRFATAATYDGYYEPSGYVGLTTGNPFNSNSYRLQVDGQANRSFRRDNDSGGRRRHGGRREDGQLQSRGQRTDISLPTHRVGQAGAVRPGHVERHQPSQSAAGRPRRLELVARLPAVAKGLGHIQRRLRSERSPHVRSCVPGLQFIGVFPRRAGGVPCRPERAEWLLRPVRCRVWIRFHAGPRVGQ